MILAERAARLEAEIQLVDARAEAANAKADLSSTEALISHLKLEIEKLRRQLYGSRSERKARLLEQMELQLEELGSSGDRGRAGGRKGCGPDSDRPIVPAQAAVPQAVPRSSAARAHRDPGTGALPLLRFDEAVEARRGHH